MSNLIVKGKIKYIQFRNTWAEKKAPFNYLQSWAILLIPMIASGKLHQNLSDYNQFLFSTKFAVNKKLIFSSEKMRNSGNCIYDYAHSFFGEDFENQYMYIYG